MTLDTLFRLIWTRKLVAIMRMRLPPSLLMAMAAAGVGLLAYCWVGATFALFRSFDLNLRLRLSYAGGLFLCMFPVIFSVIRSLSLRGLANESVAALPFTKGQWAHTAAKYHYVVQLPLVVGMLGAVVANLVFKADIGWRAVTGLTALLVAAAASLVFAAFKLSAVMIASNKASLMGGLVVGYIVIAAGVLFALYRLYIGESEAAAFWGKDAWFAVCVCLLYVGMGACAHLRFKRLASEPLTIADDSMTSVRLMRGSKHIRGYRLVGITRKVAVRDKKFWVVTLVNVLLVGLSCAVGIGSGNQATQTFFVSFLPTLLILGQATVAAEVRGLLGVSRGAIYALPISIGHLAAALQMTALALVAGPVLLLMAAIGLLFGDGINGQLLVRLFCTSLLAAQVACLISVVFFESRRDASRGLLAGIVLFLLIWPILVLHNWLQSRALLLAGIITLGIAILLYAAVALTEQKMLRKES
jgi:hypothetical protein